MYIGKKFNKKKIKNVMGLVPYLTIWSVISVTSTLNDQAWSVV